MNQKFLVVINISLIFASNVRVETDSLGPVNVPCDKYYGAQTGRATENFKIGDERFSSEFIHALALVKKAAARINHKYKKISDDVAQAIDQVADEVMQGKFDDNFPLVIWQGAGTQTNMNMNEVISNRAIEILGGKIGSKIPVHPNDHVNHGQSTNDVIPSAGQIAVVQMVIYELFPSLNHLKDAFQKKAEEFKDIIKLGRTHLQDAVPLSLGQEFVCFASQLDHALLCIKSALKHCYELPIGGTAIGTGLNTFVNYDIEVVDEIKQMTKLPFVFSPCKAEATSAHDCFVEISAALKVLAVSFSKIVNDIRLLASGPRCGIGELVLPKNEPGSSIMPGKVNPSQADAATMVCAQVIGHDVAVSWVGAHGHLQLNVCGTLMAYNVMKSIRLLSDMMRSFADKAIAGVQPNRERIALHLNNSLMLVTVLVPFIGYDKAAEVALTAWRENKTLREAISELGYMTVEEFDQSIKPEEMTQPSKL
jgi:fumarate hydratase, class II